MSGYELSENVFKNSVLYVVCSPNGNVKRPATSFSEKDEIVFHFIGWGPYMGFSSCVFCKFYSYWVLGQNLPLKFIQKVCNRDLPNYSRIFFSFGVLLHIIWGKLLAYHYCSFLTAMEPLSGCPHCQKSTTYNSDRAFIDKTIRVLYQYHIFLYSTSSC